MKWFLTNLVFVHPSNSLSQLLITSKPSNISSRLTRDGLIGYRAPFYYCKEHPKVENIYRETIEHHILYAAVHKSP